ncbi:MAG: hypothetical protein QW265_01210 [Candidatus Bathyarchaeia archaeon]
MVKEILKDGGGIFVCEKCGLGYANKTLAEKCEDFCSKHNACSLEIIKEAVYKSEDFY